MKKKSLIIAMLMMLIMIIAGGTVFAAEPILMEGTDHDYLYGASRYSGNFNLSSISRDSIKTITLLNTSEDEIPSTFVASWDVSLNNDGSVTAWLVQDTEDATKYHMHIGGTGGIIAPSYSNRLFYLYSNCTSIIGLNKLDTSSVTSMTSMFEYCGSLNSLDLSNFDTSNVIYMNEMFDSCSSLTSLDLSNFNTTNVVGMQRMFGDCTSLLNVDLTSFNTSNVTTMNQMFYSCSSLKALELGNFNTSKVTDMYSMFRFCSSLTSLDLSKFNTSNVMDMKYMFSDCTSITSLNISNFNTSKVETFDHMFYQCKYLTDIDVSKFDTSAGNSFDQMFAECHSLESVNLKNFTLEKNDYPDEFFKNCYSLKVVLLGEKVSALSGAGMFYYDEELTAIISLSKTPMTNSGNGNTTFKYSYDAYNAVLYTPIEKEYENLSNYASAFNFTVGSDTPRIEPILGLYGEKNTIVNIGGSYDEAATVAGFKSVTGADITPVEVQEYGYVLEQTSNNVDLKTEGNYTVTYKLTLNGTQVDAITRNVIVEKYVTILMGESSSNKSVLGASRYTGEFDLTSVKRANIKTITILDTSVDRLPTGAVASWDVSLKNDGSVTAWLVQDTTDTTMYHLYIGGNGGVRVSSGEYLFAKYTACTNIIGLNKLKTSFVTSMNSMFSSCSSLTSLDLGRFNTNEVTDMGSMFNNCSSLTSLDLSNFNTSAVAGMTYMFFGCSSLTSLDVSSFNTSSVTNMGSMFRDCKNLTNLELNNFNTSAVNGYGMGYMFYNCNSLISLDLSSFDTSSLTDIPYMFYNCNSLISLDLSSFDTSSVTYMRSIFNNCSSLTTLDLNNFDTSNVSDLDDMFYNCSSLTTVFLGPNFDRIHGDGMFSNTPMLTSIISMRTTPLINTAEPSGGGSGIVMNGLKDNNTKAVIYVPNASVESLYEGNSNYAYLLNFTVNTDSPRVEPILGLHGEKDIIVNVNGKYDEAATVAGFKSVTGADITPTEVKNSGYILTQTSNNVDLKTEGDYTVTYKLTLNGTEVDTITRNVKVAVLNQILMEETYTNAVTNKYLLGSSRYTGEFDLTSVKRKNINSITILNTYTDAIPTTYVASWDVSKANDGSVTAWLVQDTTNTTRYHLYIGGKYGVIASSGNYLFAYYENCRNITGLEKLNTSSVIDMSYMFYECNWLENLNLSGFDTSKVTDMSSMFCNCDGLTTLDVSNFNTSSVTNMRSMFESIKLTSLDLSTFNTSAVTDMAYMFYSCVWLENLKLSSFDTSEVTDMSYMFYYCEGLKKLDLRNFDTSKVTNMQGMFENSEFLTSIDVSSFDTSAVTNMRYMFQGCDWLTSLDLRSFDTSAVTMMQNMFSGCGRLTILYLGDNFDRINGFGMFGSYSDLTSIISTRTTPMIITDENGGLCDNGLKSDNTAAVIYVLDTTVESLYEKDSNYASLLSFTVGDDSPRIEPFSVHVLENDVVVGKYTNLRDAINSVVTGTRTIKVIKSHTHIDSIGDIEVTNGQNITIDLNGKTITTNKSIYIASGGYLKIIDSTDGGKYAACNTSNYLVNNQGTFILDSGTLECKNNEQALGIYHTEKSNTTINGGKIHIISESADALALKQNGSTDLIINNGEILVEAHDTAYGVNYSSTGRVCINGGKITAISSNGIGYGIDKSYSSGKVVIGQNDGNVSITSPYIYGSTYGVYDGKSAGSSSYMGNIQFYDGVIYGEEGKAYNVDDYYDTLPTDLYVVRENLEGGREKAYLTADNDKPTIESLITTNNVGVRKQTVTAVNVEDIGSGVIAYAYNYTGETPSSDSTSWVSIENNNGPTDISVDVMDNGELYFWVMDGVGNISESISVTVENIILDAQLIEDGIIIGEYRSIAEAYEAARTGNANTSIIKILCDITLDTPLTIAADKNITLDLNGKEITTSFKTTDAITNRGILEITDSVGNGKIAHNEMDGYSVVRNNNQFVLSGGTLEVVNSTSMTDDNVYGVYNAGGTSTIAGGNINLEAPSNIYVYGIYSSHGLNLVITDGNIKVISETGNVYGVLNEYSLDLKMTGGNIEVSSTQQYAYGIINGFSGNLEISAGSIQVNSLQSYSYGIYHWSSKEAIITGGNVNSSGIAIFAQQSQNITLGSNDGKVSVESPIIYGGVGGIQNSSKLNFYDGVVYGPTSSDIFYPTTMNITTPNNYKVVYETTEDNLGKAYLKKVIEITEEPKDVHVKQNNEASFNVVTTGENLSYQWYEVDGEKVTKIDENTKEYKSNIEGQANTTSSSTITIKAEKAGTLSFDYMVSSEKTNDTFTVTIVDGNGTTTAVNGISGEIDWTTYTKEVTPNDSGEIVLTLTYSKNGSIDEGLDYGAIRNLKFAAMGIGFVDCEYVTDDYYTVTTPRQEILPIIFGSEPPAGMPDDGWMVEEEEGVTIFSDALKGYYTSQGMQFPYTYNTASIEMNITEETPIEFEFRLITPNRFGSMDIVILDGAGINKIVEYLQVDTNGWLKYSGTVTPNEEGKATILLVSSGMFYQVGPTGFTGYGSIRNLKYETNIIVDKICTFENDDIYTISSTNWGTSSLYEGYNTSTLTIPSELVTFDKNNNKYYCAISNEYGEIETRKATLNVSKGELPILMADSEENGFKYNYLLGATRYKGDFALTSVKREKILTITLLDTTKDTIPSDYVASWDVSKDNNGSVTAWLVRDTADNTMYHLYIGGENRIIATSGVYLFYGYEACTSISGLNILDTSNVKDMSNMFRNCFELTSLNLSSFNTSNVTDMYNMFNACKKLNSINLSAFNDNGSNTTKLQDICQMFDGCSELTSIEFGNFDTSSVIDMTSAFRDCKKLSSIDVSSFNTTNTQKMLQLFSGCKSLEKIDISTFNMNGSTTENVTNMGSMFDSCTNLIEINLGKLNTTNVKNMSQMFSYCSSLETIDLTSFNTANVEKMNNMFRSCTNLNKLDLRTFDTTKVSDMSWMFNASSGLELLILGNNFDRINGKSMLRGLPNLTAIISTRTSPMIVTDSNGAVVDNGFGASNENTALYVNNSTVESAYERDANYASLLDFTAGYETPKIEPILGLYGEKDITLYKGDTYEEAATVAGFKSTTDTDITPTEVKEFGYVLTQTSNNVDLTNTGEYTVTYKLELNGTMVDTITRNVKVEPRTPILMADSFTNASNKKNLLGYERYEGDIDLAAIKREKILTITILDTSKDAIPTGAVASWDVSKENNAAVTAWLVQDSTDTTMYHLYIGGEGGVIPYSGEYLFAYYTNCTKINYLEKLDTSKIGTMHSMFNNSRKLTDLDLRTFKTENVYDMSAMFFYCEGLETINVSSFNTSNVTDMMQMFVGCKKLTSIDVSGFNTSKVRNMSQMFSSCSGLTSINVDNFNTSNVTSMNSMFSSCSGLTSIDISSFNKNGSSTNKVKDMYGMFERCTKLTNIEFGDFDTSASESMSNMFSSCSSLTTLDLSSFNTNNVNSMYGMFSFSNKLTSLDLSNFNTSNVTNMSMMFYGCSGITNLDLRSFNTSKVTFISTMFRGASKLEVLVLGDNFDRINASDMFVGTSKLTSIISTRTTPMTITDSNGAVVDNGLKSSNTSAVIYVPNATVESAYEADSNYASLLSFTAGEDSPRIEPILGLYGDKDVELTVGETYKEAATVAGFESTTETDITPEEVKEFGYVLTQTSNNVNLGKAGEYTVTYKLTLNGTEVDTITRNVKVKAIDISGATITLTPSEYIFDGSAKKPAVEVVLNGATLSDETDYEVVYSDNVNVGTATVTINAKEENGVYTGSVSKTFDINSDPNIVFNVTLNKDTFVWDGSEHKPVPTVKVTLRGTDNRTLVEGTDYTVSYSNNTEPTKEAMVIITGIKNYSASSATVKFTIEKATRNAKVVMPNYSYGVSVPTPKLDSTNEPGATTYYYNTTDSNVGGTPWTNVTGPEYLDAGEYYIYAEIGATTHYKAETTVTTKFEVLKTVITYPKVSDKIYNTKLQSGIDDDGNGLVFTGETEATDVGTYTMYIDLKNKNYTWPEEYPTRVYTWVIKARSISDTEISIGDTIIEYTGVANEIDVTIKYNGTDLVEGQDYKVTYINNVDVGIGELLISGLGNYTGTYKQDIIITKAKIAKLELDKTEYIYTGSGIKPTEKVYDAKGTQLIKDRDYTVYYTDNITIGTGVVGVIGTGNYEGNLEKTFSIVGLPLDQAVITLEGLPCVYDGKEKCPEVIVKLGDEILTRGRDYEVKYENNVNAGDNTAKVIITGAGSYVGSVEKTFTIMKADRNANIQAGISVLVGQSGQIQYTYDGLNTTATLKVDDTSVASATLTSNTINVTGKKEGKTVVHLNIPETDNYNGADLKVEVTVFENIDDVNPVYGTVVINKDEEYTVTPNTILYLNVSFGDYMYISESSDVPNVDGEGWYEYSRMMPYTFDAEEGTKTIYVWFKDKEGNMSRVASDSIILDYDADIPAHDNVMLDETEIDITAPDVETVDYTNTGLSIKVILNQQDVMVNFVRSGIDHSTVRYGYKLVDGLEGGYTWQNTPIIEGLSFNTVYAFVTEASDRAGNGPTISEEKIIQTERKYETTVTLEDVNVQYDGKIHEIGIAKVKIVNDTAITGKIIYTYYVDKACTVLTTPERDGSSTEGGAPKEPGVYYVVAELVDDDIYFDTKSEPGELRIGWFISKTDADDVFAYVERINPNGNEFILNITGDGQMADLDEVLGNNSDASLVYWEDYKGKITKVEFENTASGSVINIGDEMLSDLTKITEINIPDTIIKIGDNAFEGCTNVNKNVIIPISVEQIGNGAFANVNTPAFEVAYGNQNFDTIDGVLTDDEHKELIAYPNGKTDERYVIPDSIIVIKQESFAGADNITNVVIPGEVKTIEGKAFYECSNLKTIEVEDLMGKTDNVLDLTSVGNKAFEGIAKEAIIYTFSKVVADNFVDGQTHNVEPIDEKDKTKVYWPPEIKVHPIDMNGAVGKNVTFIVETVPGNPEKTEYQWFKVKDGVETKIEGAKSDRYTTDVLNTSNDNDYYYCRVYNDQYYYDREYVNSDMAKITMIDKANYLVVRGSYNEYLFETLQAAFDFAKDDDLIKVINDVENEAEAVLKDNKAVKMSMNNYDISLDGVIRIEKGSSLEMVESQTASNTNGIISKDGNYIFEVSGKLSIKDDITLNNPTGGAINALENSEIVCTDGNIYVDNNAIYAESAKVTIDGINIEAKTNNTRASAISLHKYTEFNMTAGNVYIAYVQEPSNGGLYGIFVDGESSGNRKAVTNITGGTIEAEATTRDADAVANAGETNIVINKPAKITGSRSGIILLDSNSKGNVFVEGGDVTGGKYGILNNAEKAKVVIGKQDGMVYGITDDKVDDIAPKIVGEKAAIFNAKEDNTLEVYDGILYAKGPNVIYEELDNTSLEITNVSSDMIYSEEGRNDIKTEIRYSLAEDVDETYNLVYLKEDKEPKVSKLPDTVEVYVGEKAEFEIDASEGQPDKYEYQWEVSVDGGMTWSKVNVGTGVTSNKYTTPFASKAMDGYKYRCVVSNGKYTVTSNIVTLIVNERIDGENARPIVRILFTDGRKIKYENGNKVVNMQIIVKSFSELDSLTVNGSNNIFGQPTYETSDGTIIIKQDANSPITISKEINGENKIVEYTYTYNMQVVNNNTTITVKAVDVKGKDNTATQTVDIIYDLIVECRKSDLTQTNKNLVLTFYANRPAKPIKSISNSYMNSTYIDLIPLDGTEYSYRYSLKLDSALPKTEFWFEDEFMNQYAVTVDEITKVKYRDIKFNESTLLIDDMTVLDAFDMAQDLEDAIEINKNEELQSRYGVNSVQADMFMSRPKDIGAIDILNSSTTSKSYDGVFTDNMKQTITEENSIYGNVDDASKLYLAAAAKDAVENKLSSENRKYVDVITKDASLYKGMDISGFTINDEAPYMSKDGSTVNNIKEDIIDASFRATIVAE